jgi:mono/diheme cytochrome c family protein
MKMLAIVMLAAAVPAAAVQGLKGPAAGASIAAAAPQAPAPSTAAPPATASAPAGDAKRGKTLFEETYRCYACHGFAAETGSPRLVPMGKTEEAFLAYVRKPATQGMPSFSDVAARDLTDVYAYLRSLRSTAPPAQDIPLLRDILQQIERR